MRFTPFFVIHVTADMKDIDKYKLQGLAVAIVDDHEVVNEGIRSFLIESGVRNVEAFTKGYELVRRIPACHFDIFIVDVELHDIEVELLIDSIRECLPDAKIIINTMHEELWVVNRLTEKHVDGVVYKSASLEQLVEAIIIVHEGRQYFSPKFKRSQSEIQVKNGILSVREIEVLKELARGFSTKEIAKKLFISENTVENHRKNMFRKLGARNVATLLIKAITAGYIDPSRL